MDADPRDALIQKLQAENATLRVEGESLRKESNPVYSPASSRNVVRSCRYEADD